MILFVDLETSDLLKPRLPLSDPSQPWAVTVAAELCGIDGAPIAFFHDQVRSEGRPVKAGAEAVHGVSSRQAARDGTNEVVILGHLCGLAARALYLVGHSIEFDRKVIESLLIRRGKDTRLWTRPGLQTLCTMKAATAFCQIKSDPPRDDNSYRWPSLDAACLTLLGEPTRQGAHSAWDDMQRAKRLFFALHERKAFGLGSAAA